MNDSISRQVAIDAIMGEPTDAHYPSWYADKIKAIPSVNAIEVVRCKDCKHLGIKDLVYGYCKYRMTGIIMPDDFCSYGERKSHEGR